MPIATHAGLDPALCGVPTEMQPDFARVELLTTAALAADAAGLVHGGFIFGLADHAAMLAVNRPTVVLAGAEVRFLAPARIGDRLVAEARVVEAVPPKYRVACAVRTCAERTLPGHDDVLVFKGTFDCRVPARHVLEKDGGRPPKGGR